MDEIKKKGCKVCGKLFKPFKTTDSVCSVQCATELKKAKEKTKETKKQAVEVVSRKMLFDLARMKFNEYIRLRDSKEPCICCGKRLKAGYHAGHFFSGGGHSMVIFNEDNVHAQNADCNTGHRAGMIEDYAVNLEKRIGAHRFELLRAEAYDPKKWDIQSLQSIIREYKQKIKELKVT